MAKREFVWGLISSLILLIISVLLIQIGCESNFPYPNFCISGILFLVFNFLGTLIIALFTQGSTLTFNGSLILRYLSILLSIPFYFFLGYILSKLIKKRR